MRIVKMDPYEMWAGRMRSHPALRVLNYVRTTAFYSSPSAILLSSEQGSYRKSRSRDRDLGPECCYRE